MWHPDEPAAPEAPLIEEPEPPARHPAAAREPVPPPAPEPRAPVGGDIIPFPAAADLPAAVSNHRDNARGPAVAHAEVISPSRAPDLRTNGASGAPVSAHAAANGTAETVDVSPPMKE